MKQNKLDLINKELKQKKFLVKRKLFNKSIFAALVFSILIMTLSFALFYLKIWWLGSILLIISLIQIGLELYIFYQINYGFANLSTILRYRKVWIIFFLTGNIVGAIYVGLLVNKK